MYTRVILTKIEPTSDDDTGFSVLSRKQDYSWRAFPPWQLLLQCVGVHLQTATFDFV